MGDKYIDAMKIDSDITENYYLKSIKQKTEQQKFIENILLGKINTFPKIIADVACGGGGAIYHISKIFPHSSYIAIDLNDDAIKFAMKHLSGLLNENIKYINDSIYNMKSLKDNYCDLVLCLQTISWLDDPHKALLELIRICKKKGNIVVSGLFNIDYDVDIYSKVFDLTRNSKHIGLNYNTLSIKTIYGWLKNIVSDIEIMPMPINIELAKNTRGLGTHTIKIKAEQFHNIQVSGGILMNWGMLIIKK